MKNEVRSDSILGVRRTN